MIRVPDDPSRAIQALLDKLDAEDRNTLGWMLLMAHQLATEPRTVATVAREFLARWESGELTP